MSRIPWFPTLALLLLGAAPARAQARTPNELLREGPPSFVAGTLGDARADREVRAQIELIRGMLFPHSPILEDTAVDLARGPAGWPGRPVLYGGPHVNAVVAALAPRLPFALRGDRLSIGGREFIGNDVRLIALVPEQPASEGQPATPAFLLYAGLGMPGVAEINAVPHGGEGFLVADRFGPRAGGSFEPGPDGRLAARLGPERPRIVWRERLLGPTEGKASVRVRRPAVLPAKDAEAEEDARLLAAAERIRHELPLPGALELAVYVYPDRRSKARLTDNGGAGHADALSGTIHVLAGDPAGLESLIVHEGTHVAAHAAHGMAGTAAMAEGLAVAVSGSYGGVALDDWRGRLPDRLPDLDAFLSSTFRREPEPVAYPLAGLLVRALRSRLGADRFAREVYSAPPGEFRAACVAAGLPEEELLSLYRTAAGR